MEYWSSILARACWPMSKQEGETIESPEALGYFSLAMGLFSGKLGWVIWVIMLTQSAMCCVGGMAVFWHG